MAKVFLVCVFALLIGLNQGQAILTPPNDATKIVGEKATFHCEVEFGNVPVMTWEHNGIIIYTYQAHEPLLEKNHNKYNVTTDGNGNFTLIVNQLEYNDGGILICREVSHHAEATLIVLGKPTIIARPEGWNQGNYSCIASFGGPNKDKILHNHLPQLTTYLDTTLLKGKVHALKCFNNFYVLRKDYNITRDSNAGEKTITCKISTENPQNSVKTSEKDKMGITQGQGIHTPPDNAVKIIGEDATFQCVVQLGEMPLMSWEHNGKVIYTFPNEEEPSDIKYNKYDVTKDGNNFTLTVHDLEFSDGGTYICSEISDHAKATLIILEKPKLIDVTPNTEGLNQVIYSCIAKFGGPNNGEISQNDIPRLAFYSDESQLNGTVPELKHYEKHNRLRQTYIITPELGMHRKNITCKISTLDPKMSVETRMQIEMNVSSLSTATKKPDKEPEAAEVEVGDPNIEPEAVEVAVGDPYIRETLTIVVGFVVVNFLLLLGVTIAVSYIYVQKKPCKPVSPSPPGPEPPGTSKQPVSPSPPGPEPPGTSKQPVSPSPPGPEPPGTSKQPPAEPVIPAASSR